MDDATLPVRIDLGDDPEGTPRTTSSLLASLAVRVRTLPLLDGAQAVGSLVAGIAGVGRMVAATAAGGRVRRALAGHRLGMNGTALWEALGLDTGPASLPPRPVLDDLRNDLALLLAPDLLDELEDLDEDRIAAGIGPIAEPGEVDFLDFAVGLWFLAGEITGVIDTLTAAAADDGGGDDEPGGVGGSLLR